MKHLSITLIALLTIFSLHSQKASKKGNQEKLPTEVVEAIEKRIAEGYTPSIAIALIDSTGIHYFNFGKTDDDGKANKLPRGKPTRY